MTDSELIAGCLAGKQSSWDLFCDRFSKLIHWSIRKTLAESSFKERRDIAEDIFQDVFRKFLDRNELARLKDTESIRKYLFVTACHAAKDRMKILRRHETLTHSAEDCDSPIGELIKGGTDPSAEASGNERRDILDQTLEGLKSKEREAMELFYLEGFSHKSIAALLGYTENGVEALIRRTREKLRQALSEKGLEGG